MWIEQQAEQQQEAQAVFGAITVTHLGGENLNVLRRGGPGRGSSRLAVYWCLDQIEDAARAARSRRGAESQDEVRALAWGIARITTATKG